MSLPLGLSLYALLQHYLAWVIFGAILVIGLFVLGLRDVSRFSLKRTWAISTVSFRESLRRRVLWVTPLVMVGVLLVSQFQRPLDEIDAIRMTAKFCMFATGLLLVITLIILACTNLPREIDNKVIFTIVTKPTTRLEVVLGKVIGFARVALLIVLIMGAFTYGYLRLRAFSLNRQLTERLEADLVSATSRSTLKHYQTKGLLFSRSLKMPDDLDVLSRLPEDGGRVWMHPEGEQELLVPFDFDETTLVPPDAPDAKSGSAGFSIEANVMYRKTGEPRELPRRAPFVPDRYERIPPDPPQAQFTLTNPYAVYLSMFAPRNVPLTDPNGANPVRVPVPPGVAEQVATMPRMYVRVYGGTLGYEYSLDPQSVRLVVPATSGSADEKVIHASPLVEGTDEMRLMSRGRQGRYGQQLRGGGSDDFPPIAMFHFRDADFTPDGDTVPMELRVGIERSSTAPEDETPTQLDIQLYNVHTGEVSDVTTIAVESNQTTFFTMPARYAADGDFDVRIVNRTPGHFTGLGLLSIAVVADEQPFELNLFRSLLVLWLLSILVVAVAVFCSTFLSWPIAVVLTLIIMLGHWGVQQLGDALEPGLGRRFVTEVGLQDPSQVAAVSESVEALARAMGVLSRFLPDISQFTATEFLERGVTLPTAQLRQAAGVTVAFTLPLVVLAYLFLKKKEVAP